MNLPVQLIHQDAKLPTRSYAGDAGLDIYCIENKALEPNQPAIIKTGIKLAIPNGHVGLVWDRGSMGKAGIKTLGGVIDSGFRGELTIHLANTTKKIYNIKKGEKIAQLLIQKIELLDPVKAKIEDNTQRGAKRFASSGK